jgi:predicted dehydrogenase
MNVAVLGLGFMGAAHVKAWGSVRGASLAAVMSSSPAKRSGDLTEVGGNLGSAGERFDFAGLRRYASVAEVLADAGVEAVDICLPTDLHASVAISALRAGKHVLVEKPMALDAASAEAMRIEAERAGRMLMAAHVLRFIPAYRALTQWLAGKTFVTASFARECGEPAWSGWLPDRARSGGPALDLLIHDLDYCISLWGMPGSVQAAALGQGDVMSAILSYPAHSVEVKGGWYADPARAFSMAFDVATSEGVCRWTHPETELTVIGPGGESSIPLSEEDAFTAELQYFTDCVTEGRQPDLCPPEQSAQAVALARFILESRDSYGKSVRTV